MRDPENIIEPIDEVPGFGNGPSAWNRWRRFLAASEADKRHVEAIKYHKDIGKTAEEIKKYREKMQKMGETAFEQVLKEKRQK